MKNLVILRDDFFRKVFILVFNIVELFQYSNIVTLIRRNLRDGYSKRRVISLKKARNARFSASLYYVKTVHLSGLHRKRKKWWIHRWWKLQERSKCPKKFDIASRDRFHSLRAYEDKYPRQNQNRSFSSWIFFLRKTKLDFICYVSSSLKLFTYWQRAIKR